jgi:hypothetical protein
VLTSNSRLNLHEFTHPLKSSSDTDLGSLDVVGQRGSDVVWNAIVLLVHVDFFSLEISS